jgi:hypothetical protein
MPIDLLAVAEVQRGGKFARRLRDEARPEDIAMRLACEHGVVPPGMLFGAAS